MLRVQVLHFALTSGGLTSKAITAYSSRAGNLQKLPKIDALQNTKRNYSHFWILTHNGGAMSENSAGLRWSNVRGVL